MSMFPAYGNRGRGGRPKSSSRLPAVQGFDSFDRPGPSSFSSATLTDRGPTPTSSRFDDRRSSNQYHTKDGHGERWRSGREDLQHSGSRHRQQGEGIFNTNFVENDHDTGATVSNDCFDKRKMNHSPSHSHSSSKKRKRKRSRSPPQPSHRHNHYRDRNTNNYDRFSNNQGRLAGNDNSTNHGEQGKYQQNDRRRDRSGYPQHPQLCKPGQHLATDDRWDRNQGPSKASQFYKPSEHTNENPWYSNENPSNYHSNQSGSEQYWNNSTYDNNRGWSNMRGNDGRERARKSEGDSLESQETRRVRMSQNFPKKVFLEEVNLGSEHAFRLDTISNPGQMNYRSLGLSQKSTYEFGKGIFGASEDEINKVYSVFHSFRCKLPDVITDSSHSSDDLEIKQKNPRAETIAKQYISVEDGSNAGANIQFNFAGTNDSFEIKADEINIREKTEYYNRELREHPQNISMWKEFIRLQNNIFETSNQISDGEDSKGKSVKSKKKSNRKALLEKKITIVDKALESNPKNIELQLTKMNFLLELCKPLQVLTEWKKLVTHHQQIAPFWMEYLLFSSSQLLVYSKASSIGIFESCFQKFRLMMNSNYPDFQKPRKFHLLISDVTLALSLLLRNSGFTERAIALHQAQLELDFFCPTYFKNNGNYELSNWNNLCADFKIFWDAGTLRFGENGAKGWSNFEKNTAEEKYSISLPDSKISEFEDQIFDGLNQEGKNQPKSNIWLSIETCRSKLYWSPWRVSCTDVDDCEDNHRVVPSSEITNFICPTHCDDNASEFDKQAGRFRHILNFLVTLREDFIVHTQTLDLACSSFFSISLTHSTSLFSEIYFWKRLADLYVGMDSEPASKSHHVFAPEGFKILDLVSPNVFTNPIFAPTIYDASKNVIPNPSKSTILQDNDKKYMEMFYRVLEQGIDLLSSEFANLLFEMFLRFEQKLTCTGNSDVKQRLKFAKGLMKQEKIRNSVGGYREIAMLEYFGGNSQKAVDLLIKTINATRMSLNFKDWDQLDWENDWKTLLDLASLYRQLVELYLQANSDSKAYYVLVQLGTGYQSIEPDMDLEVQWKPKTNVLLKVTKSFEKIQGLFFPHCLEKNIVSEDKPEELISSETYFKWNGDKCIEFLLQQRCFIVEWTTVYALFQFCCKDFDAASHVYESSLKRISNELLNKHESYNPELIRLHIREQLYINWCNLAARCLNKDPLLNSKFRNILGMALQEFPSSPPLLLLFTDVENQTSVAGKLWRLMMANMKQDSEKVVTHWTPLIMGIGLARKIEELEHDEEIGLPSFGIGGPAVPQDTIFYKLDSMISLSELHPGIRHCPLVWRVHLKLLALRAREGKDVQRARTTFYDAIRHCPSSKAIYLDGITYFPEIIQEIHDLLVEKQLLIRLPPEELDVLLETEEVIDVRSKRLSSKNSSSVEELDVKLAGESKSEGEIGDSD